MLIVPFATGGPKETLCLKKIDYNPINTGLHQRVFSILCPIP